MTQPTTTNMSFDTSLTDLHNANPSYQTTPFDPSTSRLDALAAAAEQASRNEIKQSSTPVQHIPTQDAYDQWANVYDTDGNMLQAIDDHELETFLPALLSQALEPAKKEISIIDLGCGTGRNTAKLVQYAYPDDVRVKITGLDFSAGMLEVAERKLRGLLQGGASATNKSNVALDLQQADCFPTATSPGVSPLPLPGLAPADALISTLVLEHVPVEPFFATLAALVKPGGLALVTNMHSEMGNVSQAGFVNAQGVKVRGTSFAHTVEEMVGVAMKKGFEVLGIVKERGVTEEDVQGGVVGQRGRKWVDLGVSVWAGCVFRRI